MPPSDPDRLAEALRANLKRRKERMRAQQDGTAAVARVDSGADEEGDLGDPGDAERPGSWIALGSKD